MKKITLAVIISASMSLAMLNTQAQSNTNAPSEQTFFQTAEGYLTSFNTNYNWSGVALEVAVGADFQQGMQWANDLEIQYDVPNSSFGVGYRMRNAGIGGVIEMNEAKIEYTLKSYYDTQIEGSLYAGYDQQYNCAALEPQIEIRKKLTENTFAGIYLSEPILISRNLSRNSQWFPNIGLDTGFTF